jgi:acyl carrier protein
LRCLSKARADRADGTHVTVRDVIARRTGVGVDPFVLADGTPLGSDGVGFDSVAVVELLLECETEFGVRLPRELFEGPPLTVGALVAAVTAARQGEGSERRVP